MAMRRHIVIIEDAQDTLELFAFVLRDKYDVSQCRSCAEALTLVTSKRPDLLLMDIGMSEMDGIECLKAIRGMNDMESVPAIAVTAMAFPADRARCDAAGFQAFIPKPVLDYEKMDEIIRGLLPS
jgi:CheY-like chemotaxis protein